MAKKTKQTKGKGADMDTVRYTVDIPRSLHLQFTMLATLQGKTKAELVRTAIEQMLNSARS